MCVTRGWPQEQTSRSHSRDAGSSAAAISRRHVRLPILRPSKPSFGHATSLHEHAQAWPAMAVRRRSTRGASKAVLWAMATVVLTIRLAASSASIRLPMTSANGSMPVSRVISADRCTGILEPLSDLTDPYDHTTGIEGDTLDRQIDDRMIRIEPDRLYVDRYSGADQPLQCDDGITGRWRQRAQHPVIDMRIEEGRGTLVR